MKKFLVILCLCFPLHLYSQGWSLDYSLGYGTYQLDDVKKMQDRMIQFDNLGLKVTDRFPGYITHSFAIGYMLGNHHFGGNFSYLTTGGRLHRSDYSGSYTVDMMINGYRIGTFYRNYINTGFSPLQIYLQISEGLMSTDLLIEEKVSIYNESAEESITLQGIGIFVEPTIGVKYRITDRLLFAIGCGYQADIFGELKYSGHSTSNVAHWNGLRLYGGLILFFPQQ